jgi:hypothetical protein
MTKLKGESRFIANLHFDLSDVQLCEVVAALQKFECAHRTQVAWMGPYSLEGSHLSIHALDLLSVLSHSHRETENAFELFRLRRSAVDQLTTAKSGTHDEIKIRNLEMWLDSYKKIGKHEIQT